MLNTHQGTPGQVEIYPEAATVPMSEFLMEVKATVDALCAAGSSIQDDEAIGYVVDGLDSSYRSFLTYLQFHPPASFGEIHNILLQEEDLMKHSRYQENPTPIAFAATCDTNAPSQQHSSSSSSQPHSHPSNHGHQPAFCCHGQNNYRDSYQGCGGFKGQGSPHPFYASNINYRSNDSYNPPFYSSLSQPLSGVPNLQSLWSSHSTLPR